VEPIPPTREAIEKLERLGDTDVEQILRRLGERVVNEVPTCMGLSLTLVDDNVTLTLVASDPDTTQLDAMQYLDGGPCVEATRTDRLVEINEADLLDEERWSLFARASASQGVQSSLSMPLVDQGRVVGGVNLYASTRDAFHGHHDELARIVGAQAADAVNDADLSFSTRLRAAAAACCLPAFVRRLGHRRYRVTFHPLLSADATLPRESATTGLATRWAALLESVIREHPEQWLVFEPAFQP